MSLRLLLLSKDPQFARLLSAQLAPQGFDCVDEGPCDIVLQDGADLPDPVLAPVLRLLGPGEEGGEDCLQKPVRLAQLAAALKRLADKGRAQRKRIIGGKIFDAEAGLLINQGESQRLTGKEAAILTYLFDHDGSVGRDELLESVWAMGLRSALTRWKPISTACARRSRPIPPSPNIC